MRKINSNFINNNTMEPIRVYFCILLLPTIHFNQLLYWRASMPHCLEVNDISLSIKGWDSTSLRGRYYVRKLIVDYRISLELVISLLMSLIRTDCKFVENMAILVQIQIDIKMYNFIMKWCKCPFVFIN